MDSILTSIKKLLGVGEEHEYFDADLIMHINSVFMFLTQMGVGPSEGFIIEDELTTWQDFLESDLNSEGGPNLEAVKSYMALKVRILFDPPASSVVMESMNKMLSEMEFRMSVAVENHKHG